MISVLVRGDINLLESEFSIRWKVARVEPWRLWETRGLGGVRRAGGYGGRGDCRVKCGKVRDMGEGGVCGGCGGG